METRKGIKYYIPPSLSIGELNWLEGFCNNMDIEILAYPDKLFLPTPLMTMYPIEYRPLTTEELY